MLRGLAVQANAPSVPIVTRRRRKTTADPSLRLKNGYVQDDTAPGEVSLSAFLRLVLCVELSAR
jgi:hypothetical protein